MPILVRDDDTNFFTRPEMLETIHSKAWDKGWKISLSIVPFQKGMNDVSVPPEIRHTAYSIQLQTMSAWLNSLEKKFESSQ